MSFKVSMVASPFMTSVSRFFNCHRPTRHGTHFAAGVGVTHFYKGTGHVNRAESWRTGFDSALQVFVQLLDHKLSLVGTGDFKRLIVGVPPFLLGGHGWIVTILFNLIMFLKYNCL